MAQIIQAVHGETIHNVVIINELTNLVVNKILALQDDIFSYLDLLFSLKRASRKARRESERAGQREEEKRLVHIINITDYFDRNVSYPEKHPTVRF